MVNAITTENVNVFYGDKQAINNISLNFLKNKVTALIGPSGCGKSTLLNIIGGILDADSGSISLQEFEYGTKPPNKVVDVRRNGVGWIFQDFHLVDRLSALDNVIFSLELAGIPSPEASMKAREALIRVNLADRMDFIPDQLSGGQQERVAIARAIAGNRPLLLADEPTGKLDAKSGEEIIDLFKELAKDGISILMVTHDPILASKADRMLLLKDGITAASDIRSAWGDDNVGEDE